MQSNHVRISGFHILPSGFENLEKGSEFPRNELHFNLLCSSCPAVPLYADGRELLVSGAFLPSGSVSKNKLFDALKRPAMQTACCPLGNATKKLM